MTAVERVNDAALRGIIAVLALADGILHFVLDIVLFRGRFWGSAFPAGGRPDAAPGAGPRPGLPAGGAAPRAAGPRIALPLPLNELFLLNFVGEVVLVSLFLWSRRLPVERRWWINLVMIGYVALTFTGWWLYGRPNPMGLGYLSKGIEILLVVTLIADIAAMLPVRRVAGRVA